MGAGAAVAGAKAGTACAVLGSGAVKGCCGAAGGDTQLIAEGLRDVQVGAGEILHGGVALTATSAAVVLAAAAGSLARAAEGGFEGAYEGLRGALAAPASAAEAMQVSGPLGAVAGAFTAANGAEGYWQRRSARIAQEALADQAAVLQQVAELRIQPVGPLAPGPSLPLWRLAELAAAVYDGRRVPGFRCDLSGVRDPDEKVEAQMSVFVRRNPADADLDAVGVERRDLAVIAIRGTLDVHDARRDLRSIVMGGYPGAFVLTAAEIVRSRRCRLLRTGSRGAQRAERRPKFCGGQPRGGHHRQPQPPLSRDNSCVHNGWRSATLPLDGSPDGQDGPVYAKTPGLDQSQLPGALPGGAALADPADLCGPALEEGLEHSR
ncbi:unnamed protein product [Effrenium voratum]|uniref:Uncharacterized protein n=1 Tax=Effrenium voratum TaxID=2562239 RepID=A0AA36HWQ6_9DINO|nr:unnamed protein product [Effrenium voratum]CAJ1431107.1 unnamed protein product [Effrenium voratum]